MRHPNDFVKMREHLIYKLRSKVSKDFKRCKPTRVAPESVCSGYGGNFVLRKQFHVTRETINENNDKFET